MNHLTHGCWQVHSPLRIKPNYGRLPCKQASKQHSQLDSNLFCNKPQLHPCTINHIGQRLTTSCRRQQTTQTKHQSYPGRLLVGPLSEIYGRRVVLHASSVWFLVWNVLCGSAASAVYALRGCFLGDIWRPQQRGRSPGVYLVIHPPSWRSRRPKLTRVRYHHRRRATWRWMFWSTSIFQAAMIFVSFFSFPESCGLLIPRRRAARLRGETGETWRYTASERLDTGRSAPGVVGRASTRPLRLVLFHAIIQAWAVLPMFNYGIMYVTLPTFSDLWKGQYGQPVEVSGLHYIACSLGDLIGSEAGAPPPLVDRWYNRRQQPTPESRAMLMFLGIVAAWLGVAAYRLCWLVGDVGVVALMFGMQLSGMPLTAHIIDTCGEHTSSAMTAAQFVRRLAAFLFPLFAPSMYHALGYGWANSVTALAGVIIFVPLPVLLCKCVARPRARVAST
ncbi:major facilitator superfamily domain-containing protein [Colletotrichum cereale]|nr:major facilitator superfamily domain-containing protein [Colletotrichum cereale]